MIVADTGAIYALYDADDAHHLSVVRFFESNRESIHIPVACLGELDYLLRVRLGTRAELDFLAEILTGGFIVEPLTLSDAARCVEIIEKYADADIGLADASVVALAERLRTERVLTVDRRDFALVKHARGRDWALLPADGSG